MLLRMRKEQSITDEVSNMTSAKTPSLLNSVSNHIDQFIIIDRNVDLVTPLCTELTYEGLIDETIGIKHCFVELDASLVNPAQQQQPTAKGVPTTTTATASTPSLNTTAPTKKKKYVLNSSDKLFSQLRDQNFAVVGGMLNKIAKRINENYEERHHAKTVAQIRDFVGRLSELQQEHQSLKIRKSIFFFFFFRKDLPNLKRLDTGIAEEIIGHTVTDEFNKVLEVQQSKAQTFPPTPFFFIVRLSLFFY